MYIIYIYSYIYIYAYIYIYTMYMNTVLTFERISTTVIDTYMYNVCNLCILACLYI